MKVLLDTNALIWWMEDDAHLGPQARNILANPANLIVASLVSIWEITMKWRSGKYPLSGAAYAQFVEDEGVDMIGILPGHVAAIEALDYHHKDPFDHLIIAQAKVEGAVIMTSDEAMRAYGVRCINALA